MRKLSWKNWLLGRSGNRMGYGRRRHSAGIGEHLENRLLLSAQEIIATPSTANVSAGDTVTITAQYRTLDDNGVPAVLPTSGIGLALHYQSSALQFQQYNELFAPNRVFTPQPGSETATEAEAGLDDGVGATDRVANVPWNDQSLMWPPAAQPVTLMVAEFLVLNGFSDSTPLTFTATPANGFDFTDVSLELTSQNDVSVFDGTYSGTFSGTGNSPQGPFNVPADIASDGSITAQITNGMVTITAPGGGSGTVDAAGNVGFNSTLEQEGVTVTYTGTLTENAGSVTGSGNWTIDTPNASNISGSGTWMVSNSFEATASLSVNDVVEGADIIYTVTLSAANNTGTPITFDFDDLGTGTAVPDNDYTAIPNNAQITVPIGATIGTFTLSVNDDALLESTETLNARISNPSNMAVTIGTASATANINDNDPTTANLSVTTEGNETGPVDAVFTVTLGATNNTGSPITFDLDDLGTGTATSGDDYTAIAANAQITVANGATTGTLSVPIIDDALLETTETLIAQISNSSNPAVTIGTASATANISSDETATANLSVSTQGDEAGPIDTVFTVTLSEVNNTGSPITFDLDDLGTGTATPGDDYTAIAANSQITVADGASSGTLTVPVIDDAALEGTETIDVMISNSSDSAVTIGTATATANISDDDTIAANLSVTTQGDEAGAVGIDFTVTLSAANNTGTAVTFDLTDLGTGTATADSDYTAIPVNSQITVANGATTGTLSVPVIDDALLDGTETLIAQISNSSSVAVSIGTAIATASISDNETATADLSVTTQGVETGPVDAVFTVTLSETNDTGAAITFDLDDLATGTATAGNDYTAIATNAQISVAPGATTGTLTVVVTDDSLLESTETLNAQISNSSLAAVTIGTSSATASISDNDTATADLSVTTQGNEAGPVAAVFTVTLTTANNTDSTITFDIVDDLTGTATSDTDYTAIPANSQITVAIGASTGTLTVPVLDDADREGTETIDATISNSSSPVVSIGTASATANILDDEIPPTITSNGGGETATVPVTENQTAVTDVNSTDNSDTEGAGLTYSKTTANSGGIDNGLFTLDPITGVLTFISPPNFESPIDNGNDNSYEVQVTVTDSSGLTDTQDITVTVSDANDSPVITSDGGLATASVDAEENQTAVTTVVATDEDLPAQTLTFSITGGDDQDKFDINSQSGVLTFITAPDFENPEDVGEDNIYDVQVTVTDNGTPNGTEFQDIAVSVTGVNDAPVLTTNTGLTVRKESAGTITMAHLETTDIDITDGPAELTYTVSALPTAGNLLLNGVILTGQPEFTQQQINDGILSYQHTTAAARTDSFTFTVSDGEFNITPAPQTFDIRVLTILSPIPDQTFGSGLGPVVIPVAAAVIDGDVPALTSPVGPSFVDFTDNGDGTGFFTVDPQASDQLGSPYTVTLNAITTNSGTDTISFDAIVLEGPTAISDETVHFINVGGEGIASQMISGDAGSGVSAIRNTGNMFSSRAAIDASSADIPEGIPNSIFQTQRWDGAGGPEMQFSFPVEPGDYRVNLFFAELYRPTFRAGARVFDVAAEGVVRIDDLDVFAEAGGGNTGLFRTFDVTADSTLDLAFLHQVENPIVNAIQIIDLNQVPSQSPPRLSAIGNQTASEGQTLTVDFRAPDAQRDDVTLTVSALPSQRFQFTDNGNGTGRLTVSAIEGDAGQYPITITSTQQVDGLQLTDAESFVVSVLGTNDPPQLDTNLQLTVMEGGTGTIGAGRLSGSDLDNSSAELRYSINTPPQHGKLQLDGADFTATTTFSQVDITNNLVQYVHDGSESTADSFAFTLSDGAGGSVSGTFNINITAVNDAPTIDRSNDLTVRAGGTRRITVGQLSGSDPDDVPTNLTYFPSTPAAGRFLVDGNPSATFTQQDVIDGKVEYENTNDQATTDSFTVTLEDDDNAPSGSETISIRISNVTILAPIPAQTIAAEAGPVDIPVAAASVDGNVPALTATIPVEAQSFVSFTDNGDGTGLFTFDPESGDVGNSTIELTATAGNVVETVSFTLNVVTVPTEVSNTTVHFVNVGGPGIASAMIAGDSAAIRNTGIAFSTGASINLGDTSVPDGTPGALFQTLRYDRAGGAEMNYSFPVDPGDYQVRLYFAETYGPAFRTGARVFDVAAEGVIAIDNLDVFSEVGGNAGLVKTIPSVTADSTLDITFLHQIENPIISAIEIIDLNPAPAQTAPVLQRVGNVTVNEGQTVILRVAAPDGEGDLINPAFAGLPSFVSASEPDENRVVTFTISPGEGDAGQYPINGTVTQQNGIALTDSESLVLTVVGVNEPPELTINNPLTVDEGANGIIDSSLLNSSDPDDAPDQLSFSFMLTDGPAHGNLFNGSVPLTTGGMFTQSDINNDRIEYRHDGSEESSDSFNFMLADGGENNTPAVPGTFHINISPINDAPTIDVNSGITLREGTTRTITAAALSGSDVDNPSADLIYTVTSPAPAAGTLRVDGAVSSSFTQQQVNDGKVTYTQDGTAATSDSFGFSFTDGTAPAISGTFSISITADPAFELNVNAGGPTVDGFVSADGIQNGSGTPFGTRASINASDPDVAGVPASVFQTVLYDRAGGADLSFDVAVEAGVTVEVTLFFSEIYGPAFRTGARVFDVSIDGEVRLPNFDIFEAAGAGNTAVARSFQITSDGNLDIDLGRGTENPAIAGFRIREIDDVFSNSQNVPGT